MADVIQFNCPACHTLLRLPVARASARGPCPSCQREIIAPDPILGIGAFEIPESAPPREIEPFQSYLESAPKEVEPPLPVKIGQASTRAPSRLMTLSLCCLLTGAAALAVGFKLGAHSIAKPTPEPNITAPAASPKEKSTQVTPPPLTSPVSIAATPPIEPIPVESSPPEKKPEITQVSASAEAALRAFLEAPDWASRSAHVLFPEQVRAAMEFYSHDLPDGPTPFKSIAVKQTQIDEASGNTLFIFFVSTEKFPSGIPVAVQETASGWRIDWRAFVQFRDQLFQRFADGPSDKSGRFHLIVSPPPSETTKSPENEHFVSFLLNAPLNQTSHVAFVKKASETFTTFQQATATGGFFTPVLDVEKRKTADGQTYLEVIKVIATDWIPRAD